MAHPAHPKGRSRRPSDRTAVPDDVTDRLLWALAVDVAAAHQLGPDGACTNLQCRGQDGPCWALRTALRAEQQARSAPTTLAPAPPPRPVGVVRGRAPVPAAPRRFTGWFTPARPPAPLTRPAPVPDAVPPESRVYRRPPVAALAA
ncbi:hypothetical protein O7605_16790 [Verrucosispora sp. WMMA2121]|uniref:hypothetical protein n=1 Tax=Verrucosispora sp. WMMA2121 TaxID=3015164 RepID=UPI0022B62437|nr:hypothetical protein [Verrucosispora sp. WMMA2121]MCZ7421162.1 hypothetical protein [Verrucosispora sp. WMMA2121]